MANDFVDRYATRLRITTVIQRRRHRPMVERIRMHEFVNRQRIDTRLDQLRRLLERLRRQPTRRPHRLDIFRRLDDDLIRLLLLAKKYHFIPLHSMKIRALTTCPTLIKQFATFTHHYLYNMPWGVGRAMSLSLHTHSLSPYVATAPYGLLSPYCPNGAIRAWATAMCSLRCAHTPPLVCYVAIAPYAHFVALFGRHQPAIYAYTNLPRNSCKKSSFELKTHRFCVSKAAPRRLHPLHDAKFHVACDSNAPSIG